MKIEINFIIFFFVLVLVSAFVSSSYTPDTYDNITLVLKGGYTPDTFDNITLMLGEPATGVTNLTGCGVLNNSNWHYNIVNNISASSSCSAVGYCFEIDAENVTIDGLGYTIDGNNEEECYMFKKLSGYPGSTLTISNVNIINADYGIGDYNGGEDGTSLTVINNSTFSDSWLGILLWDEGDGHVYNSVFNNVTQGIDSVETAINNTFINCKRAIYNDDVLHSQNISSNYFETNIDMGYSSEDIGPYFFSYSSETYTDTHYVLFFNNTLNNTIETDYLPNGVLMIGYDDSYAFSFNISNNQIYGMNRSIEIMYRSSYKITSWLISNNNISNSTKGIVITPSGYPYYYFANANITNNMIIDNDVGISLGNTNANATYPIYIYNNYFNNTVNVEKVYYPFTDKNATHTLNYWNVTNRTGTRIDGVSGNIGGNLWLTTAGDGFSETCNDSNNDGFCDDSYAVLDDGNNTDYLPLAFKPLFPSTQFLIWDGSDWVDTTTLSIRFRCRPTQTDCEPVNQDIGNTQSIYKVCNNGTIAGTSLVMSMNNTISNIDLKCDDDYTSDDSIVLTTSNQTISGSLDIDACAYISCWADYDNPTSGGLFKVNAYVI